MLKIHRWTGGWVFSRIQELFSFQQDVAATKKNPMCWLRRAEAEQNMTGNLVPLNTPTTHGNSWRFSFLEIWVITVITPENQGSTCFFLGTLYESSHAEMKVIVALPVGSKIHDVDLGIFSNFQLLNHPSFGWFKAPLISNSLPGLMHSPPAILRHCLGESVDDRQLKSQYLRCFFFFFFAPSQRWLALGFLVAINSTTLKWGKSSPQNSWDFTEVFRSTACECGDASLKKRWDLCVSFGLLMGLWVFFFGILAQAWKMWPSFPEIWSSILDIQVAGSGRNSSVPTCLWTAAFILGGVVERNVSCKFCMVFCI